MQIQQPAIRNKRRFGRRILMNRWAARYGYKNKPKEIKEGAKKWCERAVCVREYHELVCD